MPSITSIILFSVFSFCLTWQSAVAQQAAAKSWPWWMGGNFDGISTDSGWSTTWPETPLPVAWTNEIGIGFSSMSIAQGRLYTMGNSNGTESVYCFDAKTGEQIWRHSYECELVAVLYEGGPGSTPTIDGANLYAVGKEGQLMCLRTSDGEKVWEKSLQDDLGVPLPEWGFNASPFILGDQLILEVGRLVSYDKTTGEKKWQTDTHFSGYGSVRAMKRDGQTLLVSLDSEGLRINREGDGSEVVFEPWPSPFRTNSTTPIVHEDTIFVSTGYDVGCVLLRLNGDKLDEIYANREMRNHFNNSILFEGHLYGFDGNSHHGRTVHLTCMNHKTGEVLWKHRGLGCGSLMIADEKLLLLSEDGRLVVAEAKPEGFKQLAESQILEGRCWTVPVLLDGRVYARNAAGKLVCVELPVGE
jgi:outer membrane protein assembly factor BamB